MACTTLTVTAPNPIVTLSNVGFGDATTPRYTSCTQMVVGILIGVTADYSIANFVPGTTYKISGNISFTPPLGGTANYTYNVSVTQASGVMPLNLNVAYQVGAYSGLVITGTATVM